MAEVTYKGKTFEVDEDGFLLRFDDWCPEWLEYVKESEGISEITPDHRRFLIFCRITTRRTVSPPWCVSFPRTPASS